MRTSYNNTLKSNGIKRIILILLVAILAVGFIPAVSSSYAYADDGSYNYDNAYYMLTLVNQERAAYGLSALEMDYGMLDAAMTRAYECSYYFSHYRPDGGDASSLNGKIYSENISWGMSADRTMVGWMDSSAHRDNILDSGYASIGIGSYITSGGTPYWVLVFSYESADGSGTTQTTQTSQDTNSEDSYSEGSAEESGTAQEAQEAQDANRGASYTEEPAAKSGWEQDDNGWYFYSNGDILTSQWVQDGDEWYYLKDDGYMAADEWIEDSEGWMCFGSDGKVVKSQWMQDGEDWNYLKDDGYMAADEWLEGSEGRMWVDSDGKIVKSKWVKDGDSWYYLKDDGYMAADKWVKDSKGLMWVGPDGKIVSSKWLKYGDNWYYLKADGHVAGDVKNIEVEQYKYNNPGRMISNRHIRYVA